MDANSPSYMITFPPVPFPSPDEDEVGEAIKSSGIPRQQLWITSKLWNSFHHPDHVEKVSLLQWI